MGLSSGSHLYWAKTISYLLYTCQITWKCRRCWQPKSQNSEIWGLFCPCMQNASLLLRGEWGLHYNIRASSWINCNLAVHNFRNVLWTFVHEQQSSEVRRWSNRNPSCVIVSFLMSLWGVCHFIKLFVCLFVCSVVLNYYHKSCTNPNVLCFCPSEKVTLHCIRPCMHACKCTYASCAMHIYVYILLYLWNVVLIQIYYSKSMCWTK